jgi:hypothetical protein
MRVVPFIEWGISPNILDIWNFMGFKFLVQKLKVVS